MWQHVEWKRAEHYAVTEEFKKIAIAEMKHAEKIAERFWYLGGKPTTKPSMINVGDKLKDMLDFQSATRSDQHVRGDHGDSTEKGRRRHKGDLRRNRRVEEEKHRDFFRSTLE
jgi:bacterioferritin